MHLEPRRKDGERGEDDGEGDGSRVKHNFSDGSAKEISKEIF